ncbi:MAG: hypothetical protein LAT64_02510 [Phycisphaerales bacterium]|nr:hypothetical protein [Planctomycetota bacterium]MCH8507630.1 hypothetical protein [Phycisphaerales bacterium]
MDRRDVGMLKQSPGSCKPARCLWKTPRGEVWTVKPPADTLPFDHAEEWLVLVLRPDEDELLRDRFRLIDSLAGKGWATPESVERNADKSLVVTYSLRDGMLLDTWVKIPRTKSESAQLAYSMVRSLANAHKEGLIHGRLSPSCVIVTPNGPAFVDLPLGPTGPGHDFESDARWAFAGGARTFGCAALDVKGLAAGIVWILTGHTPQGGASPIEDLQRLGVPDRLAALLCDAVDPQTAPPELDTLHDAFAQWFKPEEPAGRAMPVRLAAHKRVLIGTSAAALAIGGVLGLLVGHQATRTTGSDSSQMLARYQAELDDQQMRIETLQRREALRQQAIRSLQESLAYSEHGPGIHPIGLPVLSLIELLTWPLGEEGAGPRAKLHSERIRSARNFIAREHAAANADHIEVMLTEVALGAWELQHGNLPEARRVLDDVALRLSAYLEPSDPIRKGTEQLLRIAREGMPHESVGSDAGLEPWVVRVLAAPIDPANTGRGYTQDATIAGRSVNVDQPISARDLEFTLRMKERIRRERSLAPTP